MDLYKILEISPKANADEIKKAYRKLALKHHPDRGGSSETFGRIATAYGVLSNEKLRAEYDRRVQSEPRGGARRPKTTWGKVTIGKPSIFGPLYDELLSKLDAEGVSMSNADDLVDMAMAAAKQAKNRVPEAVKRAAEDPSGDGLRGIIEDLFGPHVTFGKGD